MKDYADYMLLLSPSNSVKEQIKQHKLNAAITIGDYKSMHSIAHISMIKMHRQKTFLAEPVIRDLGVKLNAVPPVTLSIDGFEHFNHGSTYRTIYAKISSTPGTSQWFKALKRQLNIRDFIVPHITITRNIPITQFDALWPRFKNVKWNESFTVTGLTILKRETFSPHAQWEPFIMLPFNGKAQYAPELQKPSLLKPTNSQQISLF